ncbi:unnamed protein product [Adineta steineri]|uniref:G-protein coupled receptors family 1 profile domain-containing protein n=1 Tax=Adineta steineri TaxID=433720 RepID=A0A814SM39_9BILA|nr:unnamed protein product [Adineta steineri]CAF1149278.1 unnamed protein product [Adineta steineri]CAF3996910.1 unnamed protein product [Adineta steineri]CAF4098853.1 unnamed protein product [Adineta steineri]
MSSTAVVLNNIYTGITRYYLPVVFVIGLFTNVANILIFSYGRLRTNICSWYFICLSISQILILFFSGLYRMIVTGWNNGYDYSQISMDLCKFRSYGVVLSVVLSRHFLCLILLDRWMITSRSASLRNKSSLKHGRWLILFSFVFWMLFTLQIPVGNPSAPGSGCGPTPGSIYFMFYTVYTIVIGILPLFIMILFVFLIMKNLRNRGRAIHPSTRATEQTLNHLPIRQSRSDFQLIRLSVIQIMVFIIFNAIYSLFPLYVSLTMSQVRNADRRAMEAFIINIGQCLLLTYAAVTFALYILASSVFRQEFQECCKRLYQQFIRIIHHVR